MSVSEDIQNYYADLLILQYRGKPKARETIKYLISLVASTKLALDVKNSYHLNTSKGKELDVVGKYSGVSRFSGAIELSDKDYRTLILLKAFINVSGSSTYDIQIFLKTFFEDKIFFFDYKTMRVGYFTSTQAIPGDLIQVVIAQDILPYPMAVERSAIIYAETVNKFFGFRSYGREGVNNTPLNEYQDYKNDQPFLSYSHSRVAG